MHEKSSKPHETHSHKGKIAYLESRERRGEFSPEQLFSKIPLEQSDNVLDFGAGTGYFSLPLAKKVMGKVYAMDIDQSMLDIIAEKAIEDQLTNIVPLHAGSTGIPLPDASIDLVIASLVLHEIKPLAPTLDAISSVLKKDGFLVCIELEPKNEQLHKAPRITAAGMEEALTAAGFRITQRFFPAASLYMLIAQK